MNGKIGASHVSRRAIVYVRQSSMAQVWENTESTTRQYGLVQRAVALGWRAEDVVVIDEDLGRSGSTTDGRTGFSRLADEIARGRVGAVFALEMSRLARSSSDWQQLLRLCRLADVLVGDESVIYDPSQVDDRLLLDLKGTMSEAELHWLGLRLVGARKSKARRGELRFVPATGYVWHGGDIAKDPDEAVQSAVQLVFDRFAVEPSAWAVVAWARRTGFKLPTRVQGAGGFADVVWRPLGISRLCSMLRNPVYAGAYAYGRSTTRETWVDGKIRRVRVEASDTSAWPVRLLGRHPGYITWEQYLQNREKLRDNLSRFGEAVRGSPREGPSLLSGIVVCGRCGHRMNPASGPAGTARYVCPGDRATGGSTCWSLEGAPVDRAVEGLFLETMVPGELELALAVAHEAEAQADALAGQWRLRIERAEYEARLAERRYTAVDPENRVVARTLEAAWETRLRDLERLRADHDVARQQKHLDLTEADLGRIRSLASNLRKVWGARTTRPEERQAMLRMVVDAVCLLPIDVPIRQTRVQVQWRAGDVSERFVPRPGRGDAKRTPENAVQRLAELVAAGLRDEEIAAQLNAEGTLPGGERPWTPSAVSQARRRHELPRVAPDLPRRATLPHPERFPDGRWSIQGLVRRTGVSDSVVRRWISRGLVRAEQVVIDGGWAAWHLDVTEDEIGGLLSAPSRVVPAKPPLPDQLPDGRWTVPGLARRFGVDPSSIRNWMRQGRLDVLWTSSGPYRRVAGVLLDASATELFERRGASSRRRDRASNHVDRRGAV